jgi:hypothetical protein
MLAPLAAELGANGLDVDELRRVVAEYLARGRGPSDG